MLNRGAIDLGTYQRAMLGSIAPYEQPAQTRIAATMSQDTKEAVNTILAHRMQRPELNLQQRIREVLEQQLEIERRQEQQLSRVADALGGLGVA